MSHIGWPEIEAFPSVRKSVVKYPELLGGTTTIRYAGKIKLHGTNAAIQLFAGRVVVQSRARIITPGDDNEGFAAWVATITQDLLQVRAALPNDIIVFGEWCGHGIMKGVAVNQIGKKVFAVFSAIELPVADESRMIVNPAELYKMLKGVPDIHVLPWHDESFVDVPMLETADVLQPIFDKINENVAEIERCDPWVKETFGVEGVGEGLVFYPVSHNSRKAMSDLMFKAKGDKHRIVSKAKPVQLDPAVATGINDFAAMVLTESRLEQGARTAGQGELKFEKRLMGPFLAWINKDIEKETVAELEASGLVWKQVQKTVSAKARAWYMTKAETL